MAFRRSVVSDGSVPGPPPERRAFPGGRRAGILLVLLAASARLGLTAPVATHPRLWITQADLPRLRAWASASNPVYAQGIVPALAQAVTTYQTKFFPGGVANPTFPDGGTSNWEQYAVEAYALFFAFNSLVDPIPANRIQYAQWARNLLMHAIDQAADRKSVV
jgi:hypothetical protein